MLRFIAILTILVYQLVAIRTVVPLVNYQLNKQYIATILCENKSDLIPTCNGKCHLVKQLKKISSSERSTSEPNIPKPVLEEEMIYLFTTQPNLSYLILPTGITKYFSCVSLLDFVLSTDIPPPRFS